MCILGGSDLSNEFRSFYGSTVAHFNLNDVHIFKSFKYDFMNLVHSKLCILSSKIHKIIFTLINFKNLKIYLIYLFSIKTHY